MNLVRWNPWPELSSLQSHMDRLFNDSLAEMTTQLASEYTSLPVDIKQTDNQFTIVASVPGFNPEEVEVTFDQGVLTIRGVHSTDANSGDGQWIRRERRCSSMFRQLSLPAEVEVDNIAAEFQNGVLTVTVPRVQKSQPKRIHVSTHEGSGAKRLLGGIKKD